MTRKFPTDTHTAIAVMHYEKDYLTNAVVDSVLRFPHLFVIDDHSTNPYQRDREVEVIRHPKNVGFLRSVNRAMVELYTREFKFAAVLNNDITGMKVSFVLDALKIMIDNPEVAAVSPAVYPNGHNCMMPGVDPIRSVNYVDWVCPIVRLAAWQEVGGFDEVLKGFGCDIDWCKRARDRGWRFVVMGNKSVKHLGGATVLSIEDPRGHNDMVYMTDYLKEKWSVSDVWDITR